jgi:hypothetical protein
MCARFSLRLCLNVCFLRRAEPLRLTLEHLYSVQIHHQMSLQCIIISFRLFFFAQLRRVLRPMGAFGEVSHQSLPERGLGQAWTRGEYKVLV